MLGNISQYEESLSWAYLLLKCIISDLTLKEVVRQYLNITRVAG
jgi:hypothetical protein